MGERENGDRPIKKVTTKSLLSKDVLIIWGSQWERCHFNHCLFRNRFPFISQHFALQMGPLCMDQLLLESRICFLVSVFIPGTMHEENQFVLAKQRVKFWITKIGALLTEEKHKNEEAQNLSTSGTYSLVQRISEVSHSFRNLKRPIQKFSKVVLFSGLLSTSHHYLEQKDVLFFVEHQ